MIQLRISRRTWEEVAPGEWAADPNKRYVTRTKDTLQWRAGEDDMWRDVPIVPEEDVS